MPLFSRKSDDEKRAEELATAERAASIEALERGGIPIPAQRRLDELRKRKNAFFTSDLSVNEFLLSRQTGITPISQVMGSSVYHVGWQYVGNWGYSGELTVMSQALNQVRILALGRLAHEAQRAGANVVLGVHIDSRPLETAHLLEFQAIGTAARLEGEHTGSAPALTNLSGQDVWKLYQSGWWPVGIAAGSTVYHSIPSWSGQSAMSGWGSWYNQEITDFTAGVYEARHLAMGRVHHAARNELGATGVVGVSIDQKHEEYEVELGNDRKRTDLIFTFHVIGTAITEIEGAGQGANASLVLGLR